MKTTFETLTKKQQKIFNVSTELFYEKGYTETSVRDIAEVLNIQAASLYAHISSKEQILEWIAQNYVELLEIEMTEFNREQRNYSEQLKFIIKSNIVTIYNNKKYADIFRRYMKELSKEIQKKYEDFKSRYEDLLMIVLTHFQDEKHLQYDPSLAAKFLMYNMNYAHKWIPEEYTAQQIIEIFEDKIIFALLGQKLAS